MREWLSIYLKGVFMGASDSVPGVSGGTIALITGIYDRLISAIAAFDPRVLVDAVRFDADARRRVVSMLRKMDLAFLVVLGAGVASGLVVVARVMTYALDVYTALTFAFFFGLIAASAVVLYEHVNVATARRAAVAVAGFVLAFAIGAAPTGQLFSHDPVVVFLSGTVAVSAMVLPGISGSLILLVLGQYEFMLGELETFVDGVVGLVNGGTLDALAEPGVTVVVFVAGAVVGLLTVTHVIQRAFRLYRAGTLTFLVSLMAGALSTPATKILDSVTAWTPSTVAGVLGFGLVGAGAVLLLDRYTDDLEY